MAVLTIVLYTVVVIIALLLIGIILIQPSKSGGFGGSFGGVGESVFGAYAGSHLTKITVVLISLFLFFTLLLATITGRKPAEKSVAEINAELAAKSVQTQTVPAVKKIDNAVPAPAGEKK
jgi:preprotein translocase subunit SecG